jgi:hypothetical protein
MKPRWGGKWWTVRCFQKTNNEKRIKNCIENIEQICAKIK